MENSERLGRQARPGIKPGTSRVLVYRRTSHSLVGLTLLNDKSTFE